MKIVIDAMGSDMAPGVEVEGAIQAVEEFGYDLILVGDEALIRTELERLGNKSDKISVVHSPERIDMNEPAALSVRRKRKSSIVMGLEMLKRNEADGSAPPPCSYVSSRGSRDRALRSVSRR